MHDNVRLVRPIWEVRAIYTLLVLALTASLWALPATPAAANPSPITAGDRPSGEVIAGRYIVSYDESVSAPAAKTKRLEAATGFRARFEYGTALKGFAAGLSPPQVHALRATPGVSSVVPDRKVHALGSVPVVPGDLVPTGIRRIEAGTTSTVAGASATKVAIVDTGIDLSHPDLNAEHGKNCIGSGPAADDEGHGTHVAGTVGAKNNGAGVIGVAPGTNLYAVKVLDSTGSGSWSSIICGIDWITATNEDADPENDIRVANLSLGGPGDRVASCGTTTDPLHASICRSTAAGVTYVVAAGNEAWDFDYARVPDVPAAYPQVLTVTAMADGDGIGGSLSGAPCGGKEKDDFYASFSSYAATSAGAAHTISGPGVCIRSTTPGGTYGFSSGTSMATPHVAALVASCIHSGDAPGPCAGLTVPQIVQRMRADAEARTTEDGNYGFAGDPTRPVPKDYYYGYLAWARPPVEVRDEPEEPILTTSKVTPSGLQVTAGTWKSGEVSALAKNDNVYLRVQSTSAATFKSAWYGTFAQVPKDIDSLEARYRGKSSAKCRQRLSIWDWTTNRWSRLDLRWVGKTEVKINAPIGGNPADYVSGASGPGEVRLRVKCTREASSFTTRADVMRLVYTHS